MPIPVPGATPATGVTPWTDYLDVTTDVLPWLQITAGDLDQNLATNLQAVTSMVCTRVQQELGQPIAPTSLFRRFDGWSGWNGAYIELPYYPVIGVDLVTEWWGRSGPHTLEESTPDNQVDGYQIDQMTGRLTRVFVGNVQKPWFPGSRNIEVTWLAGYASVPMDVKVASLEWIQAWWRTKQQQSAITNASVGYDETEVAAHEIDMFAGMPDSIRSIISARAQVGIG